MRLKGKVAIVTGAASGIGLITAGLMVREGARVVVSDIYLEGAKQTAGDIVKSGGVALAQKVDIAISEDVRKMVDTTFEEFGRIDILVNCAALVPAPVIPLHQREISQVEKEINITLTGTIRCCMAVIPHMLQQRSGRIVNLTSVAGKAGLAKMSIYSAAKAGVAGFTRAIAQEVAAKGITVNCVCPGTVKTAAMSKHILENPKAEKAYLDATPMHRMAEPEEIAAMIIFLASDEASYITGQEIVVDGGTRM